MKLAKKAATSTTATTDPIIVIGNGMVGHRFCRTFRTLETTTPLIVFGKESVPAYDRVNLTKLVTEPKPESLYLAPHDWYTENNIDLRLSEEVTDVDTYTKTIVTSTGESITYGKLIVATGSKPWIPPIPGADGANVFPYRTIDDIDDIRAQAAKGKKAVVIGGGILGLEAAQALQDLDVDVQILEIADYLMPQQLDAEGGMRLKEEISNMGIFVRTRFRTETIIDISDQKVIQAEDGTIITCDFIVVSAGIRPETSLLVDSDVKCNPNGAVVVDNGLETSDPHVYAIGECATFEGTTFGLVAPGYQMADVLADRLTGGKATFKKPDLSARLKVMGVHVAALGDYFQSDPMSDAITFSTMLPRSEPCYRKLIVFKRRVIGIMVVGAWDNLPAVQQMMEAGTKLSYKQLELFEETGELFKPAGEPAVMRWSDSTQVCNCMMVTKGQLVKAIEDGAGTVEELGSCTMAGTVCGSCKPVLGDLVGAPSLPTRIPASAKAMIAFSLLAFFGVGATVFAAPLAYADSVEVYWYKVDQLWRDNILRQVTGYALFALCLGALFLSVQKRFQNLKIGNYSGWRAVHTATGVLTLAMLFLHTGLNLGTNFNSWLMLTFALLNLLGGVSGIFSALENKTDTGYGVLSRRLKPVATWAHILLFWPIPTLVLFHIASVYYW